MCGGFVALYAGDRPPSNLTHLAYNVGRLLTYLGLGALAGFIGGRIDATALQAGFVPVSATLMGALLVFWGALLLFRGGVKARNKVHGKIAQLFGKLVTAIPRSGSWKGAFLIGLISTLLPCGWLYTFVLVAAAAGSTSGGLIIMFVFWLGTVPALAVFGKGIHALSVKWGAQIPYLTATLMIIAGVFAISGKLMPDLLGMHAHHGHSAEHHRHTP